MNLKLCRECRMEAIHEDRREDRRYPIQLELRYKVVVRNRPPINGTGGTLNMSSGGVLFSGDQPLPTGAFVELSVNWPIMLQAKCPLTLLIVGRVVRCQDRMIAVKLNRYEFHTRPSRAVPEGPPPPGGKAYLI